MVDGRFELTAGNGIPALVVEPMQDRDEPASFLLEIVQAPFRGGANAVGAESRAIDRAGHALRQRIRALMSKHEPRAERLPADPLDQFGRRRKIRDVEQRVPSVELRQFALQPVPALLVALLR